MANGWGGRRPGAGRKPRLPNPEAERLLNEVLIPEYRAVLEALLKKAKSGDTKAIIEINQRLLGSPHLTADLAVGGEFTVRIVRYKPDARTDD